GAPWPGCAKLNEPDVPNKRWHQEHHAGYGFIESFNGKEGASTLYATIAGRPSSRRICDVPLAADRVPIHDNRVVVHSVDLANVFCRQLTGKPGRWS
ncbi:hypothetical protein NKI63_26570, partial [Mesorhizobium sp. M0410]|uniref:hypothetical protein n=1 Tax=Mesorhizobium sp. M0410 TaxID=2956943 RepID=UPI00333BA196